MNKQVEEKNKERDERDFITVCKYCQDTLTEGEKAQNLLSYTYKVIANDIVSLLSNEFSVNFNVRKLTERINHALSLRGIEYSYQRLHQLIIKAREEQKGGETK